jgi:hypothetical protein
MVAEARAYPGSAVRAVRRAGHDSVTCQDLKTRHTRQIVNAAPGGRSVLRELPVRRVLQSLEAPVPAGTGMQATRQAFSLLITVLMTVTVILAAPGLGRRDACVRGRRACILLCRFLAGRGGGGGDGVADGGGAGGADVPVALDGANGG